MQPEADIIEGCKKGIAACQEALYTRYAARMMSVCLRYAVSSFEAEDIFHDAFVRVFQHIDTYQGGSFEGWLRRIFVNTTINNYHKNKPHYHHLDSHELEVTDNSNLDVLQTLSNQELLEMISQLPNGYRMVFNLYVLEGYNHREIGEILGISEGTYKSQLAKAKNLLKQYLRKNNISAYAS